MDTAKKAPSGHRLVIRITAAILAVVMISGVVLYQQAGVTLSPERFEAKGTRVAARELLRDDAYAGGTRISRMAALTANLFSGRSSMNDLERSVQISIAQADYPEAIAQTEKMLEGFGGSDEERGRLLLRLGYLFVMTGDSEKALQRLNEGIALSPTPEAYLVRAQVQLVLGHTDEALSDVGICLQTAENAEELLADAVNIYEDAGRYEEAADMYSRLIDRPGGTEYLINRAYCLLRLNRTDEAAADRDRYAAAGGKETGSFDVMIGLGWMRAEEWTKAGDCFIRALDGNYTDPQSLYYYVVKCAYKAGDFDRVRSYGDQLIARIREGNDGGMAEFTVEKTTGRLQVTLVKTENADLYRMTGAAHLYAGNYSRAEECLTACLAEEQTEVYAYYLRGVCRMAAERYTEAIADFDAAIEAEAETEKSYYSRAVCRMQAGDREGALADYQWVVSNGTDASLTDEAARQISRLAGGPEAGEPGDN